MKWRSKETVDVFAVLFSGVWSVVAVGIQERGGRGL
jgi:hypothetical protein